MKNSQQHLGNEANLATFSLSHDVIFLMVSPLLGRFLVSFNLQSAICGLQSAVCSLQSAVCSLQSVYFLRYYRPAGQDKLIRHLLKGLLTIQVQEHCKSHNKRKIRQQYRESRFSGDKTAPLAVSFHHT